MPIKIKTTLRLSVTMTPETIGRSAVFEQAHEEVKCPQCGAWHPYGVSAYYVFCSRMCWQYYGEEVLTEKEQS